MRPFKEESGQTQLPVLMPLPIPQSLGIPRYSHPSYQNSNGFNNKNGAPRQPPSSIDKSNLLYQYENNQIRPNRSSSNNAATTSHRNNDPNEELVYKLNKHIYNKQIARSEDNLKSDEKRVQTTRVIKIDQGSPPPPPRLKGHADLATSPGLKQKTLVPKEKTTDSNQKKSFNLNIVLDKKPGSPVKTKNHHQVSSLEIASSNNETTAQLINSPFKYSNSAAVEKLRSNSLTSIGIEAQIQIKTQSPPPSKSQNQQQHQSSCMKNFNMSLDNLSVTGPTTTSNHPPTATTASNSFTQNGHANIYQSHFRSVSQKSVNQKQLNRPQSPSKTTTNNSSSLPRPTSQTSMVHSSSKENLLPSNLHGKAHANVFANMNMNFQSMITSILQTHVKSNPKLINQANLQHPVVVGQTNLPRLPNPPPYPQTGSPLLSRTPPILTHIQSNSTLPQSNSVTPHSSLPQLSSLPRSSSQTSNVTTNQTNVPSNNNQASNNNNNTNNNNNNNNNQSSSNLNSLSSSQANNKLNYNSISSIQSSNVQPNQQPIESGELVQPVQPIQATQSNAQSNKNQINNKVNNLINSNEVNNQTNVKSINQNNNNSNLKPSMPKTNANNSSIQASGQQSDNIQKIDE